MKIVETMKWIKGKALSICIAETEDDLSTEVGEVTLAVCSLAYTAEGKVYVLSADGWNQIGGN